MSCFGKSHEEKDKMVALVAMAIKKNYMGNLKEYLTSLNRMNREPMTKTVNQTLGDAANRNIFPRDTTMLHMACYYNRPEIAQYLLDAGADINAKTSTGTTPLYLTFGVTDANDPRKKMTMIERYPIPERVPFPCRKMPIDMDPEIEAAEANTQVLEDFKAAFQYVGDRNDCRRTLDVLLGEGELDPRADSIKKRKIKNASPNNNVKQFDTAKDDFVMETMQEEPSALQMSDDKENRVSMTLVDGENSSWNNSNVKVTPSSGDGTLAKHENGQKKKSHKQNNWKITEKLGELGFVEELQRIVLDGNASQKYYRSTPEVVADIAALLMSDYARLGGTTWCETIECCNNLLALRQDAAIKAHCDPMKHESEADCKTNYLQFILLDAAAAQRAQNMGTIERGTALMLFRLIEFQTPLMERDCEGRTMLHRIVDEMPWMSGVVNTILGRLGRQAVVAKNKKKLSPVRLWFLSDTVLFALRWYHGEYDKDDEPVATVAAEIMLARCIQTLKLLLDQLSGPQEFLTLCGPKGVEGWPVVFKLLFQKYCDLEEANKPPFGSEIDVNRVMNEPGAVDAIQADAGSNALKNMPPLFNIQFVRDLHLLPIRDSFFITACF